MRESGDGWRGRVGVLVLRERLLMESELGSVMEMMHGFRVELLFREIGGDGKGDEGFRGVEFHGAIEDGAGGLDRSGMTGGKGADQPPLRVFRLDSEEVFGNGEGGGPVFCCKVDTDADFEGVREVSVVGGEGIELVQCGIKHAEVIVAFGGFEAFFQFLPFGVFHLLMGNAVS